MELSSEEVLIKIVWENSSEGWIGKLVTADENGLRGRKLVPGTAVSFELTDSRRCTGYNDGEDGLTPCPKWKMVEQGQQCYVCRQRDADRDYIEGRSGKMREGEHSVYLAQCGERVKVGVTRTNRLWKRWIEQGAVYASEIESGLSADEALQREQHISSNGIRERIAKREKLPTPNECFLREVMDDFGVGGDILQPQQKTIYQSCECRTLIESGRCVGKLESAIGQVIQVSGTCIPVFSGRVIAPPKQAGLNDF